MASVELVVFDMAGTTVRDDGLVLACFLEAARGAGLSATADEINARMGMGKLEVFAELAGQQRSDPGQAATLRDAAYGAFRVCLEARYQAGEAQAMPGAREVFRWLRAHGVKLALNTGFYRRVTDVLMERLEYGPLVDAVLCVDDVPLGRPAPFMIHGAMARTSTQSVRKVAVVGDTPSDMRAGHNAGAGLVIGVSSGSHPASVLRREGAHHVLDGVWELPELLRRHARLTA